MSAPERAVITDLLTLAAIDPRTPLVFHHPDGPPSIRCARCWLRRLRVWTGMRPWVTQVGLREARVRYGKDYCLSCEEVFEEIPRE